MAYRDLENCHVGTGPTCVAAPCINFRLQGTASQQADWVHPRLWLAALCISGMRLRSVTSIQCSHKRRWTTMNSRRLCPRMGGCICQRTVPFPAPAILCRHFGVGDAPASSFLLDQSVFGSQRVPIYFAATISGESTWSLCLIKLCHTDSCPVLCPPSWCFCDRLVRCAHTGYGPAVQGGFHRHSLGVRP